LTLQGAKAVELLSNGSFEAPAIPNYFYTNYGTLTNATNYGGLSFSGWSVPVTNVDIVAVSPNGPWTGPAAHGVQYLDLVAGCCNGGVLLDAVSVSAIPEASTWAMMILGFMGVGFMSYRRKGHSTLRIA